MPKPTSIIFSQAQQMRAKRSDVDCGSKICFLTHAVIENCFVYTETNQTDCKIPCTLAGCSKELHHFIDCPIWRCFEVVTTTAFTTTTTLSTTKNPIPSNLTTLPTTTTFATTTTTPVITESPSTLAPLPPLDHPAYLYSSVALNILFFLILWTILIQKCKKCISRRIRRFRNRNNTDPDPPIIRTHGVGQRRSQSRPESRNSRNSRNDFGFTSSSEDFDSREHIPLLHSRSETNPGQSPRVPSFLNSPVLPPTLPRDTNRRQTSRSASISSHLSRHDSQQASSHQARSSLFDSDQQGQGRQTRTTRQQQQSTGTGLFGSFGAEFDGSTFRPNSRQTRKDTSWRKDHQESKV
jgi:hypothetical protein